MSETSMSPDSYMQEYLDNPLRVSILAQHGMINPVTRVFTEQGLSVDFKFTSIERLERGRKAIKRDGLGALAVIGSVSYMDYQFDNSTRHVPYVLSEMGLDDTSVVHIPVYKSDVVGPCPPDEGNYPYTQALELNPDIRFSPRRILEEGAQLVKSLVEVQPAVE